MAARTDGVDIIKHNKKYENVDIAAISSIKKKEGDLRWRALPVVKTTTVDEGLSGWYRRDCFV